MNSLCQFISISFEKWCSYICNEEEVCQYVLVDVPRRYRPAPPSFCCKFLLSDSLIDHFAPDQSVTLCLNYTHPPVTPIKNQLTFLAYMCYKVNRCLGRYSPHPTTTNRPTNRAPNKPAWPGPKWPKMPILGQIWSFLGKKSFFLLEKSKVLLPT